MHGINDFNENSFLLDVSSKMIKHYDKSITKILENTPQGTDLKSLETSIFVRMMSLLIGKTILRVDLTKEHYRDLSKRVEKCFKKFQLEMNGE
jgi:hypothetical protein